MRLLNKVCIITGSSRGIGSYIAKAYAKEGAIVVVTYQSNKKKAEIIAKEIGSNECHKLEVNSRRSIRALYRKIYLKYKRIDVLVNNAGVNKTNDFNKQTEKEWDEVINTDLNGVFKCCQEALPYLKNGSKIINIGSLSGEYGGPRTPSYAAAKMAVMALTHNLARFLAPKNICVNCLSPGVISGEFTEKTMSKDVKKTALRLVLLKRFGKYEELNGAALYLASDESNYCTGQTISVNGGAWVRI